MQVFVPIIAAAVLASPAVAADAVQSMHGIWKGDAMALALDVERSQGRVNPDKPFQWERLIVKSVAGNQVVFTIGARLYVATVEPGELLVEAPGFAGPQRLRPVVQADDPSRSPPSPDSAESAVADPLLLRGSVDGKAPD